MKSEIQEKLEKLAIKRSTPFCYSCYKEAPSGHCETCGSDDLMRYLAGVGVEYGTEWIIQHILSKELVPVDVEEAFEASIRECYAETIQVGWMTLDTVDVMKAMDPISWRIAQSEWEDSEAEEGHIVSFDNGYTYYDIHDFETMVSS